MSLKSSSHTPGSKAKSAALPRWTSTPETPEEHLLVALAGEPGVYDVSDPLRAARVRLVDELDALAQLAEHADDCAPVARLLDVLVRRARAIEALAA